MLTHLSHDIGNLLRGDHGRHGEAVADALGHRHDVGHDSVALEAPEVLAGSTETGLTLFAKKWCGLSVLMGMSKKRCIAEDAGKK